MGIGMTLTVDERTALIAAIREAVFSGTLPLNEAVRRLRKEVTGLPQNQFAKMCKISLRTLIHIEAGDGNQTVKSLNLVFQPFGMQVGMVPMSGGY
jgi:DNA-binding XRE family transcriptional regulator